MDSVTQEMSSFMPIIDMGSNGIRFTITNTGPSLRRAMTLIYEDRVAISLYDAQFQAGERRPIPQATIDKIVEKFNEFKIVCSNFSVQADQIHVLATETTRTALNSTEFLEQIRSGTGIEFEPCSKDEEGLLGAMGVASSFSRGARGVVIDLGGGSVQLTWMEKKDDGEVLTGPSKSFPYGAAALMAGLGKATAADAHVAYFDQVTADLKKFFDEVHSQIDHTQEDPPGSRLLLSGGGMRRWAHLLMSLDQVQPYPIPIVNGYTIKHDSLLNSLAKLDEELSTCVSHRLSNRGHSQLPAIRFLLQAVLKANEKPVTEVIFCQGGIREGYVYQNAISSRALNPYKSATLAFARPASSHLASLLIRSDVLSETCMPPSTSPSSFWTTLLFPLMNVAWLFDSYPKDIRAAAALRSTTTGPLASAHGVSHVERAALALALCERYGGERDVPVGADREFLRNLQALLSNQDAWWAKYIGCIVRGLVSVCSRAGGGVAIFQRPSGSPIPRPPDVFEPCSISREFVEDKKYGLNRRINVQMQLMHPTQWPSARDWASALRKLGKRKKEWVGEGEQRWGMKIGTITITEISLRTTEVF